MSQNKFWKFVGRNPAEEMFWADLGCFSVAALIALIMPLYIFYDGVGFDIKFYQLTGMLAGCLLFFFFSYSCVYEFYKAFKLERILFAKNKAYSKKTLFFRGALGGILSLTLCLLAFVAFAYSFDLAVVIDRLIHR